MDTWRAGKWRKSASVDTVGRMETPVDPLTAAVAAELRAYRAASRLTIDQLAEASGLNARTLKRLLNAQRDIDVRVIDLLSRALEFDPDELMARAQIRVQRGVSA